MYLNKKISCVLPTYKSKDQILDVIMRIESYVDRIYIVDDCCPLGTGQYVKDNCTDERVKVIFHKQNKGVGGAVITGYKAAIEEGMDVVVKIDSDGQMDPCLIPRFIGPIIRAEADYTKGNRFFFLNEIHQMPKIRIFGNSVLSFMTKFSTGYWNVFDPTNGYTAINARILSKLDLDKIEERYFFESDMLFRLNIIRAVVEDVPMDCKYAEEVSNLHISKIIHEFHFKHLRNFFKRIFYNYYLRDMSIASFELPIGFGFLLFGLIYGLYNWIKNYNANVLTPTGTIALPALLVIVGIQLLLSFINYDVSNIPHKPLGDKY